MGWRQELDPEGRWTRLGAKETLLWKFPMSASVHWGSSPKNVQREVQVSKKFHLCCFSSVSILFWVVHILACNLVCYFVETKETRCREEGHLPHLKTLPESYRDEIRPTRTKAQLARLINDIRGKRLKILEKGSKRTCKRKERKRLHKLLVCIAIRK